MVELGLNIKEVKSDARLWRHKASKIWWCPRVQWLNGLSRARTQRRANVAVVKEAALQLCHPDRVPVGDRASAVSHFLDHFSFWAIFILALFFCCWPYSTRWWVLFYA
jgi:hypothetical protein